MYIRLQYIRLQYIRLQYIRLQYIRLRQIFRSGAGLHDVHGITRYDKLFVRGDDGDLDL